MKSLIIIPAYTHINQRLQDAINQARIPLLPLREMSDLPRCRSLLLSMACRQKGLERVITIDSDIVPTVEQLLELDTSELVTPDQALTGMYALRGHGNKLSVHAPHADTNRTPVFAAEWAGLGFACIHKESLLRLANALPTIQGDDFEWVPFCVPRVEDRCYMADDRVLWWRLRNAGVTLMASRSLHVGHLDSVVRY